MVARSTLTEPDLDALRETWASPREFIRRLWILNHRKRLQPLDPLFEEQLVWIDALTSHKYVLGLKPRQVGFTTLTTAYFMWKAYTSKHAVGVLQIGHEEATQRRLADMLHLFWRRMPAQLRCKLARHNMETTRFAHNEAEFQRAVAGGRGQGRGFTFTDLHATEMSKWPRGSASTGRAEEQSTDEEMFASALATMHDEDGQVVVESTGSGPYGLYYNLSELAKRDPTWAFVFIPWTSVPRYELPVADPAAFEDSLSSEEEVLYRKHGVSLRKLAWRRHKMQTEGLNALTFRREFPRLDTDPFILDEAGWFNQDACHALLALARPPPGVEWPDEKAVERMFHPPEPGRRYYMGVDTSGGTGGDESVIVVLRDDGLVVYVWGTNHAGEWEQASQVSRIGGLYGRPLCIIEQNNHGDVVTRYVEELGGVVLWTDEKGGYFWSTGGKAGHTKRDAMSFAREFVNHEWVLVNDAETCRQLMRIVEKPNGKIEGSGSSRDDRAMALVLAIFAARTTWSPSRATIDREKERIEAVRVAHRRWGLDGPSHR